MAVLEKIWETYNYLGYECADFRSRHMFPSPIFVIILLPAYIYFCNSLGPRLMKNRQPFQLKTTMFYYNLFQIFVNMYIFYEGALGGWFTGYSYTCQPIDWTDNPRSRRMLTAIWWYATVKIIDLLDTVFFVLRKKDRQISFLHVFHHSLMVFASYVGLKYYPNGHGTDIGYANTVIHTIMYTYYLIAGLGPKYQKYLWWKKYLTIMQIIQFVLVFIHNMMNVLNPDCDYPKWISVGISLHAVQFIVMFSNFYYVNYIQSLKQTKSIVKDSETKNKGD